MFVFFGEQFHLLTAQAPHAVCCRFPLWGKLFNLRRIGQSASREAPFLFT